MTTSSSRLTAWVYWVITLSTLSAAASSSNDLILRNANRNENMLQRGEIVSTLIGDVVFLLDDFVTKSDWGRWWQSKKNVQLRGNVRVLQDRDTLSCDQMVFTRKTNILDMRGRVDFRSPEDQLRVRGRRGRYHTTTKKFNLTGDPSFVRYDTASGDTLTIIGDELIYEDSTKVATALRHVRITRGLLIATCHRGTYYTREETATLRGNPLILYDGNTMEGDSVDLYFAGDTLRGVSVSGDAHAEYLERDASDTNVTHVWGDSMYLAMNAEGDLDSVWAWGEVRSTYYLSSEADSANEVSGKAMVLSFEGTSDLLGALVWGNARSIYFVREDDGQGRNEASGDTIRVSFDQGKARELTISGSVRGVYSPEPGH